MTKVEKRILEQVKKYFRCGNFYKFADDTYISHFDKPVTGIYLESLGDDIEDIIAAIPKFSSAIPHSDTVHDFIPDSNNVTYGWVCVTYNLKWLGNNEQGYIRVELTAIHSKISSGVLNVSFIKDY